MISPKSRITQVIDQIGTDLWTVITRKFRVPQPNKTATLEDRCSTHNFQSRHGQLEPGFRRNGQTFFVEMSYLCRRSFGG